MKICIVLAFAMLGCTAAPKRPMGLDHVTVPLLIEGNRPFVDIILSRQGGSTRTARFLLDTGGGGFLLTESLARELGLTWGASFTEDGRVLAPITALPAAFLGAFPLELNQKRVFVMVGSDNILPKAAPGHAEGVIPGHVLARYQVVFDYPKGEFTLALPGTMTPTGDALPMPVSKPQGFPQTDIEVGGVAYGLLLDTGASFTMVSEVVLKAWGRNHPEWPRHLGASGEAATLGGVTLETMFVPQARWGAHQLTSMGVVSQPAGFFERSMSAMMTTPIIGSLAGNILKHFRVDLDYPNERLYLSAP